MEEYLWLVILGGGFAFLASMGIGANDAANAFATSVGAKTLKLWHAILIAAIFEFSGVRPLASCRGGIRDAPNTCSHPSKNPACCCTAKSIHNRLTLQSKAKQKTY